MIAWWIAVLVALLSASAGALVMALLAGGRQAEIDTFWAGQSRKWQKLADQNAALAREANAIAAVHMQNSDENTRRYEAAIAWHKARISRAYALGYKRGIRYLTMPALPGHILWDGYHPIQLAPNTDSDSLHPKETPGDTSG